MSRVRNLVAEIEAEDRPPKTITQTVRIPESSYHKLRVLAPLLELPYGNLASRLLIAAIDDAIDSLPEEPRRWDPRHPHMMTAKEYVLEAARDAWIDASVDEPTQPTLRGIWGPLGQRVRRSTDASAREANTASRDE